MSGGCSVSLVGSVLTGAGRELRAERAGDRDLEEPTGEGGRSAAEERGEEASGRPEPEAKAGATSVSSAIPSLSRSSGPVGKEELVIELAASHGPLGAWKTGGVHKTGAEPTLVDGGGATPTEDPGSLDSHLPPRRPARVGAPLALMRALQAGMSFAACSSPQTEQR